MIYIQPDCLLHHLHKIQSMSFEELKQKYAAPIKVSLVTRAKRKTKKTIKSLLRVIGGGQSMNTAKNMDYSLCFVFDCQEKNQ